jgi:hypothetical protein
MLKWYVSNEVYKKISYNFIDVDFFSYCYTTSFKIRHIVCLIQKYNKATKNINF